ncbi:hypothetical protein [Cellulomonas sp. URHD0024]|uniref:hypothetical protein n=1 Tax=Cellulomonas sp. URHD0024 TaxID=1302620 RepID=UPI0004812DD7|nr:hypothetical protein [Cellulomonas sp. URHD0024]
MLRTVVKIVAAATFMMMVPVAAYAVNVSDNDGSGEQHRTLTYANGARVTGSLKSTSGKTVYYSGKVALGGCSDKNVGRYSDNTNSTSAVTRGGEIFASLSGLCGFQGVKSRVCHTLTGLPDSCGPDSSRY